jgi:hypothetical protein
MFSLFFRYYLPDGSSPLSRDMYVFVALSIEMLLPLPPQRPQRTCMVPFPPQSLHFPVPLQGAHFTVSSGFATCDITMVPLPLHSEQAPLPPHFAQASST